MAGLLAQCFSNMLTSGSHRMRRARGPRGVSHSACALALTSTDRLNESCARHRAAAGSVPSQPMSLASAPRPALLGRRHSALLGRIDGSAGHNARVPVVDVRCGQRTWRMARSAWRRAGGGRCVEIWRLRPPRAASGGAEPAGDFWRLPQFEAAAWFSSVQPCGAPRHGPQSGPQGQVSMVHPWGAAPHGT